MELKDILKKPIITEKATAAGNLNRYAFMVTPRAKKQQIIKAIEKYFGVHVKKIWSTKTSGQGKKAVVQLAEGEKIDLFKSGE